MAGSYFSTMSVTSSSEATRQVFQEMPPRADPTIADPAPVRREGGALRHRGDTYFQHRSGAPRPYPDRHGRPEYVLRGLLRQLLGADHLEVLVDEDVVWPVDADVVDLVFAVAQLHDAVDNPPGVGRQRSLRRLVGCRSTDDRP